MIVKVIVLRSVIQIDKTFTYSVPLEFQAIIKVGARIMVPFGPSEKLEAVVFEVLDFEEDTVEYTIKPIEYVFKDGIFLTQNMLTLVEQIRASYLCTYSEALQLFLPSGTSMEVQKFYALTHEGQSCLKEGTPTLKEAQKSVLAALADGEIELETSNVLKRLMAMGLVSMRQHYEAIVKERYVDRLSATPELISALKKFPKNHTAKIKLAEVLIEREFVNRIEIQEELKISKTVVDNMIASGLILSEKSEVLRLPEFMNSSVSGGIFPLTPEQKKVYYDVLSRFDMNTQREFLLHGVTGSGKTEVYAKWIETMISRGKRTILMVPEIALTPQIVARFVSKFGKERVALIHSKISPGEKFDQWKQIKEGAYDLIIGARSAIFAPCEDLGLIIIDECHESSYRSEKRPKYSTLEVARMRAEMEKALIVQGSATPSIASYYEASNHAQQLVKLDTRWKGQELPEIEIVDMREELSSGNVSILSERLYEALKRRLERKEQSIILLNRKGHSTFVSCRACGFTLACPHCDVTLTYFKGEKTVRCNYCHYETFVPKKCPKCESTYFKFFGLGTEKLEEQLLEMFPQASIARMDRTTTTRKGSLEKLIYDVENENTDILIGTQMVAKGFHFKNVTLIGILSADLMLNLPNFNASERAYQLFQQVAGRAGRGELEGEVILQTYNPDHYALKAPNFEAFYDLELDYRKSLNYPPFSKMIHLVFSSKIETDAREFSEKSHAYLCNRFLKNGLQNVVELYKAHAALLKKIDGEFRWQIVIKVKPSHHEKIKPYIKALDDRFSVEKKCKLSIDLDANHIL